MKRRAEITKRARLARAGVALSTGAVLLLSAACSPSASSGGAAKPPEKITFGEIVATPSHTPLYVAVGEGFFKKEGLDVTVQMLTGGTPSAMASMATGSVDVMMSGSIEFVEYTAKKVISGKVIGELQDSTFDIVSKKGVTDIQQLKGKTLGISGLGGGDQIYMLTVLQHYGIAAKDVTFITTGNSTNRLTALSAGSVWAIAASNSARATSEKIGSVLLSSADSPIQIPTSMIFANQKLVTDHKPVLQKFLKAMGEATAWTKAHPQEAAVYCTKSSGASAEVCLNAFKALSDPALAGPYTWSSTYAVNVTGMQAALDAEAALNPETRNLKLEDIVDTSIAGKAP